MVAHQSVSRSFLFSLGEDNTSTASLAAIGERGGGTALWENCFSADKVGQLCFPEKGFHARLAQDFLLPEAKKYNKKMAPPQFHVQNLSGLMVESYLNTQHLRPAGYFTRCGTGCVTHHGICCLNWLIQLCLMAGPALFACNTGHRRTEQVPFWLWGEENTPTTWGWCLISRHSQTLHHSDLSLH